jgi:predicted transcriptional regulator
MNALCTMLDIGRASLYRAFDKLERDGFIIRQQKTVRLLERDRMLHYYK